MPISTKPMLPTIVPLVAAFAVSGMAPADARQVGSVGTKQAGESARAVGVRSAALVGSAAAQAGSTRPRKVRVTSGAGRIRVTWKRPRKGGRVLGYEVRYRRTGQQAWSVRTTTRPATTLKRLPRGPYRVKVRARFANTAGRWSTRSVRAYRPFLPLLRITTEGRAPIVSKEEYVDARMRIRRVGKRHRLSAPLEIRGRGNSTWPKPKKPYNIKLEDDARLLGMPEGKKWSLLANWFDPSAIRNSTAFHLGRRAGLAWTPASRFVEVELNGRYDGLYLITESVDVAKNRVDIEEMSPADRRPPALTGGYLIELDRWSANDTNYGFVSSLGDEITVKSPEPDAGDGITEADLAPMLAYIRDYVNTFEASLRTGQYGRYIDTRSFIDWFLVQELVGNKDGPYSSGDFYKPRSQKLFAGPLWDLDRTIGSKLGVTNPRGWWMRTRSPWFSRLFQSAAFVRLTRDEWSRVAPRFAGAVTYMRDLDRHIRKARAQDLRRWPQLERGKRDTVGFMTTWLRQRMRWMGNNL